MEHRGLRLREFSTVVIGRRTADRVAPVGEHRDLGQVEEVYELRWVVGTEERNHVGKIRPGREPPLRAGRRQERRRVRVLRFGAGVMGEFDPGRIPSLEIARSRPTLRGQDGNREVGQRRAVVVGPDNSSLVRAVDCLPGDVDPSHSFHAGHHGPEGEWLPTELCGRARGACGSHQTDHRDDGERGESGTTSVIHDGASSRAHTNRVSATVTDRRRGEPTPG